MINNCFTSKKKATNESDNASKNEVNVEPPEPTKSRKRRSLAGFSKEETPSRIKNIKRYNPSVDWRIITQIKINYTYITKNLWCNDELPCKEEYIIQLNMLKTIAKLFSHSKCYESYNVLSYNAKCYIRKV